jgi:hypothetical protein
LFLGSLHREEVRFLRAIFISYRRNDAEGEAGRLFDDLVARFSDQSVFMDVHAILPGHDFRKAIDESVESCSVLLAIMGLDWFESRDKSGHRRLDDENDFVRLEIASALRRGIPVIPVLVRGAKMPPADQLPADLKDLAYRNAVELTHARWKSDVQLLTQALHPYIGPSVDTTSSNRALHRDLTAALASGQLSTPPRSGAPVSPVDPDQVERLSKELAAYIGPIAEIVARRAAKRATSVPDFHEALAREIESDSDRTRFLAFCRR